MSATGETGGRPLKAGVPVADFMSGAHLYAAIVTALYERERTGVGRVVEVSMLESMFATLLPAAGHTYESHAAPKRSGNRHVADSYVPFDTFETS
jgi:crotonobetainyl-CoA:carnitine CoA-transferase CaiB-like acyl-CoA transferase